MSAPYRQFCPVAKAMELLDERWTLLVVRELLYDSRRFNDLRRGLPTMSPTLLSKRLQQLVRDLHRNVDLELVPAGRTVVTFQFPDMTAKRRSWWLVLTPDAVDVCDFDPGY